MPPQERVRTGPRVGGQADASHPGRRLVTAVRQSASAHELMTRSVQALRGSRPTCRKHRAHSPTGGTGVPRDRPESPLTRQKPLPDEPARACVVLHRSLSNPSAPLRSLITRSQRKTHSPTARPERPSRRDQRGPVATHALKSQTRLSYPQCQKLIDAYVSGMPVKQIAERFGVHRTTATRIVARSGANVRNRPIPGA